MTDSKQNQTNTRLGELIGVNEIALMLGLSRVHVVGRITKRPDFPKPTLNLSQRIRRWKKSDVESWIMTVSKGNNR
jgi:predicted DNA-binding transcriptional regulator AlpA